MGQKKIEHIIQAAIDEIMEGTEEHEVRVFINDKMEVVKKTRNGFPFGNPILQITFQIEEVK